MLSHVQLLATPWTIALQVPLPMGFPRHEYWSELPFPPPGDLFHPRIKPTSSALQLHSLLLSYWGSPIIHLGVYLIVLKSLLRMHPVTLKNIVF